MAHMVHVLIDSRLLLAVYACDTNQEVTSNCSIIHIHVCMYCKYLLFLTTKVGLKLKLNRC